MTKKSTLENIKLGDVVMDKDGNEHEITQEKFNRLLEYKRIKGNTPIFGGKIIGKFIHYNNIIEKKLSTELELDKL